MSKIRLSIGHKHLSLTDATRTSFLSEQLTQKLKDKRMIFSKDELQLTSIVGQGASTVLSSSSLIQIIILGESGLVYKGYLDTAIGKELVAIKTAKGGRTIIITQMHSYMPSFYLQRYLPLVT